MAGNLVVCSLDKEQEAEMKEKNGSWKRINHEGVKT